MSVSSLLLARIILDCLSFISIVIVIYTIFYYVKKLLLLRWIEKAVNAAEVTYIAPKNSKEYSLTKKEWVINFLKDNDLVNGVSDKTLDDLIEFEVSQLEAKQKKLKSSLITDSVMNIKSI